MQHGVGSKRGHGGGHAGGIVQIERQAEITAVKGREAGRRAARPHGRRHFMTRLQHDPEGRGADKTRSSGNEQPHSSACA